MPKGLIWGFVVTLVVIIIAYTFLKYYHIDGSDTLAIAMSSLIAIIIAIQNAAIKKDLEKVKNQTNGMTSHIIEESRHLRRQVDERNKEDDRTDRHEDTTRYRSQQPRKRNLPKRTNPGGKHPNRGE